MKKYLWVVGVILVAWLLLFGVGWGVYQFYRQSLQPVSAVAAEFQLVDIDPGTSSRQIAATLEGRGLIRDAWSFRWYVYKHGIAQQIQAGLYRFSPDQTASEIADMLARGETAARALTITGGMRLNKVIEQLRALEYSQAEIEQALKEHYDYSVLKDKPPEAPLEGYLYPDTYRAETGVSAVQLIDLILSNTERKITPELRNAWAARGLNVHQGLTLASIVQKEVAKPQDQRMVAQVFLKRLAIGMKLEADPTFQYAAYLLDTEPSIDLDSPYNTYRYPGLPPAPISSVEDGALQAVANPTATDWLYFVSDKEGNTYFSTDEAQHKQYIEKYLR